MSFRLLTLAVACAVALPVYAQSASDSATDLDEVVVTANRAPVPVRDLIAPVEVIDRDAIVHSQARSLPELLRGRAGITVANQGGPGKLTSVFLRGAESDHVLVLVDGVRIGSVTSGQAGFQDLPLELIERVEIVRGPRSSLYGSEAIGGVIQIFTRRDTGGVAPRLAFGAGSHDSYEASAGVGGRVGRGWFGADYGWTRSEGIDACRGAGFPIFAGCFTTEPDRDGYERESLSLRGGVELNEAWTVQAHALRAEADNEYDGSFVNRSEIVQQVVGGSVGWTPSETASITLSAGRNRDASDNLLGALDVGYFDTDRDIATLQGNLVVGQGQLLSAGFDWLRDRVDSDLEFARTERVNRAVFAQYLGDFGRIDLQASARSDDNDQFGEHTSGNLAVGFDVTTTWRLTASVGNAFRAPSFNDLYYPFGFGNPDLEPERSRTVEAGVAWRRGTTGIRLDLYRTSVDDLVAFDFDTFLPQNVQTARLRGAELTGNVEIVGWNANASLSIVDAENRSADLYGLELPRRASQSARVELDRDFGDVHLGVTAVAEGGRYDDLLNTRRVAGYGLLDLRAEYALSADWRVQARVANVFDRDYETVAFYNQPGRTWFLTFRYAPAR
ncbi:TonB-dependent vitamin B12 receptor [Lysobacter korlensis]|uniref:TonB-dependent vitamin B12 receptor n=1 Tax=Lysobacter korlensis TaxID=553636 RepID=A0ABV6RV25_9GAMM